MSVDNFLAFVLQSGIITVLQTSNTNNMSYSIEYANAEQTEEIVAAINSRDVESLYNLAQTIKKQGDDETAEALLTEAKRFEKEDWAYDESVNN